MPASASRSAVPEPTWPMYSLAERDRRWKAVRALMDREGVEHLIVTGEWQICSPMNASDSYLTNDRPGSTVIFPREGDPHIMVWSTQVVAAHAEGQRHNEASWVKPANVHVGKAPERLAEVIKEMGLERSHLGVVGLEPTGAFQQSFISQAMWSGVTAALPNARFKPVGYKYWELMVEKSPEEVACLRQAANAGERMTEAMRDMARVGVCEHEIAATIFDACFRWGASSGFLILQTGAENTCWGTPNWTVRPQRSRKLEDGDIVLAELFPCYGLLETQQQVAIGVGNVSADHKRAAAVSRKAYDAGLAKCKPGNTFGEMAEAMEDTVLKAGGWFLTPQIHCMNPMGPMLGRNAQGFENCINADKYRAAPGRPPRGGDIVLKPGMSFAFEPNCHFGHKRMNIGGTVVVTETGCEELNTLCNDLMLVPAR